MKTVIIYTAAPEAADYDTSTTIEVFDCAACPGGCPTLDDPRTLEEGVNGQPGNGIRRKPVIERGKRGPRFRAAAGRSCLPSDYVGKLIIEDCRRTGLADLVETAREKPDDAAQTALS